jgi:hypothetical protein
VVENNLDIHHMIMPDKLAWTNTIHAYKHVVTHYFACKMELWILFFVSAVYGLLHYNCVHTFGSSREAIHAHMSGYLLSHVNETIDTILAMWTEHAYFVSVFHENAVSNTNGDDEVVAQAKVTLDGQLELFKSEVMKQLDDIFTSEFGITAVHPGVTSSELVKPVGGAAMGYQSVHDGMFTHGNVLATKDIQFLKFERETDLYCHVVNLTNQVFCHGCSAYCWNHVGNVHAPYDALQHSRLEPFEMKGAQFVKEPVYECRFGFGKKQRFEPFGQGNLTLGMEPVF